MERGWKPYVEMSPTCPRCGSLNTKFCYYNNYSLTQPRYFCKGCRRYWTKGGSLRNVPVGGGCRKTRRAKAVRAARHGLSFGSTPSPYGNLTGPIESNATSSNIDLAVVYANFLNQHPQPAETNQLEILPPLPIANHHPFEFVNVGGMEFGAQLSHENCTTLSDWSLDTFHSKDLLYMCGLDSGHKQHDITSTTCEDHNISTTCDDHNISAYELPPLPGEELVPSADMIMWSNSNAIVVNYEDTLHGTPQLLGLGPEADHDQGHELMGGRSMFGLLNYGTSSTRP